jgi:cytosine/adenosine deaminase-related metal-dependent hydrolase
MSKSSRRAVPALRGLAVIVLLFATYLAQQSPEERLVIDHVTIFDGTGGPVIRNGAIVIQGDRIRDIGRRGNIRGGPGVTILDATGKFAIPGLIDAHVHFDQSADIYARPDAIDLRGVRPYSDEIAWTRERLPETLMRYLRAGVTGVVDMGGPLWSLDFRDNANKWSDTTSVAAAGPLISTEPDPELESDDSPVVLMENPNDARDLVARVAARKPDLIKILFIHRPGTDLDRQAELVKVAIAESHRRGIRVAVHATQLETAKAAMGAGADILVHSVDDRRVDTGFLAMLKARDVIYIPTLMVTERYDAVFSNSVKLLEIERRLGDPEVIQSWDELHRIPLEKIPGGIPSPLLLASRPMEFLNLQLLAAADMRIAVGTDAGNIGTPHGPAIHREMELMVEAGMRPFDVLVGATRTAADVMGRGSEVGTLTKGKLADLVLMNADPVINIRNTQKIFRVMKAGRWVELGPVPSSGSR